MFLILFLIWFLIMYFIETVTERIIELPITPVSKEFRCIYSVYIPVAHKKDILSLTTSMEFTNDEPYNVQIITGIIIADSPSSTKGKLIAALNGYNLTPAMHHGIVNRARQYRLDQDMSNKYINVIASAASDAVKGHPNIIVEKGYGHLDVVIHKA